MSYWYCFSIAHESSKQFYGFKRETKTSPCEWTKKSRGFYVKFEQVYKWLINRVYLCLNAFKPCLFVPSRLVWVHFWLLWMTKNCATPDVNSGKKNTFCVARLLFADWNEFFLWNFEKMNTLFKMSNKLRRSEKIIKLV